MGWQELPWILAVDAYNAQSSAGAVNYFKKTTNGLLHGAPKGTSWLHNIYDQFYFRGLRSLLDEREVVWRQELASQNEDARQPRKLQTVINHTKEVYFKSHEQYRSLLQGSWIFTWIYVSWDGSLDDVGSECMFNPKKEEKFKMLANCQQQ